MKDLNHINNWPTTILFYRFLSFYIYSDDKCIWSYLEAYDGSSPAGRFIGRYCSNGVPSIIRTKGNQMYIKYINRYYYDYGYFYGSYTTHGKILLHCICSFSFYRDNAFNFSSNCRFYIIVKSSL